EEGFKIDEDSLLIEESLKLCGIKGKLKDMSPVAVEKGFTEDYIRKPKSQSITKQIQGSFKRISQRKNLVVIEGTGHAGVGSVFDHSNAKVAKTLGSKVILVSSGGIGRPIDEIVLNKALFDREGVKLAGVIINKVIPEKFGKINELVRRGLRLKGIDVLGVIPYKPMLSYPTVRQISQETGFKVLPGYDDSVLDNYVAKIVIGAMQPKDAERYIIDQSLIITPGDREDIIQLALNFHKQNCRISGIVLTGDVMPGQEIMQKTKEESIPILSGKLDTYTVASRIYDLNIKIRPNDIEKIETVEQMIQEYVNLDMLLRRM
ncbi:MAG: AAA family ATPase, partial [Candidatus Omnitrophota bacterium]